jgi:hypothetical protein
MKNRDTLYYRKEKFTKFKGLILLALFFSIFFYFLTRTNKDKTPIKRSNFDFDISVFPMFNKIKISDLKGKLILFNIYKLNDLTNIFSLHTAKKLQEKYENKIVIIDVINDDIDFDDKTITDFIIKNNIERPLLMIKNFNTNIKNERHFVLLDKNNKKMLLEDNLSKIDETLTPLAKKLNKPIFVDLEKNRLPEPFIKNLSFIKRYANNFVITDSNSGKLYILNSNGNIIARVNNLCYPQSFTLRDTDIYLADFCDNSIKKISLQNFSVENFFEIEKPLAVEKIEDAFLVSTPTKLLKYENNNFTSICDDCSNVFKFAKYADNVYFISNGYIKYVDKNFNVHNFVKIDDENNNNLYVDETGIYLADRFNNRILNVQDEYLITYNKNNSYNLPTDIVDFKDKLYITNENNKEILSLDKITKEIKRININFNVKYAEIKNEIFLHIKNLPEIKLSEGNNKIKINLRQDYTLERFAPQSILIFEEDKTEKTAMLIKEYTKDEIINNVELRLPDIKKEKNYYIKTTFYYYKKDDPFLVKNYTAKIILDDDANNNEVQIDFIYN